MSAPRPSRVALPFARAVLWACFPALGVGLFAPAVVASSDLGVVSEVARALGATDGPRTLSIASSAGKLFEAGHALLGAVVVLTTFVVPVTKLLAIDYGVRTLRAGGEGAARALGVAGELGRWAFLEVLVVALLLAVQTAGRFGLRLELRWGFAVFAGCAATTLVLAVVVERALRRSRDARGATAPGPGAPAEASLPRPGDGAGPAATSNAAGDAPGVRSLDRFVEAQDRPAGGHDEALAELRAGQKRGHWVWWVLPQLAGLGTSPTSRHFGVAGLPEAVAYLRHPRLRARYGEVVAAVRDALAAGRFLDRLMGSALDARKAVSSFTLFAAAARAAGDASLAEALEATLALAAAQGLPPCAATRAALANPAPRPFRG